MADYFVAARAAMQKARRSIHILGWAFDPDTPFAPGDEADDAGDERFGPFIRRFAVAHPGVDVRILIWKSALPIAATQNFFPHRARLCFAGSPVRFRLDGELPLGACHHQKVIVVDDAIAFVGGCDIGPDRWDTMEHLDQDARRKKRNGRHYESRHETMALVDGPAAVALGEMFRARWERSSGEIIAPPAPAEHDPWPAEIAPAMGDARVGLSRSEPRWRLYPEVRETEKLHLASIAAAKRSIYLENQYFASPVIAEALAARLEEDDGPEVLIVSTQHSPSWFDQMTMDRTRIAFIRRLQASDRRGRFHAYSPVTRQGRSIIVHSKLAIIDDDLVRVGSANLNNRSTGFDTECDLAVEADEGAAGDGTRAAIAAFRSSLIAHWLHRGAGEFSAAAERTGSLAGAVQALDDPDRRRLRPIPVKPIGAFAAFVAAYHLGDPAGPRDSWRPWLRRKELAGQLYRLSHELQNAGLACSVDALSPETV